MTSYTGASPCLLKQMAYKNGRQYTTFKGIELAAANGAVRFNTPDVTPTTTSGERLLYVNSSNQLIFDDGSSSTTLGSAGGVVNFSLNDAYDDGRSITIDAGAVTLNGVNQDTATLALNADVNSSGPIVLFTNSGTGNDVTGTSSLWSVSAAGAVIAASLATNTITASATNPSNLTIDATGTGTITLGATSTGAITLTRAVTATASLTITGTADSNVFTITAGDMLMSNGKVAITNDDTDAALTITAASVTTGNVALITANGVTSGNIIKTTTTNAGFTGYHFLADEDGATKFSVGPKGATTIAGNATGTAALTITAGDFAMADGVVSLTQSADSAALTIVADAQVTTTVIDVNADAITSGVLLHLDTTAATFSGKYIQCYDGAADDFSVGADGATVITTTAAGTVGLTITHGGTTGDALQIATTALTTGDALQITSTAETIAAGELLKIVNTENGDLSATPKTGNLASITSSVTMTTASTSLDYDTLLISRSNIANEVAQTLTAAGSVLKLLLTSTNTAGTCTDSTVALEVETVDGGTAAPTGDVVKVTSVGVGAKAINVVSASTTVSDVLITGSGVKANNKASLEVTNSGATAAGGSVLRATNTGTPAAATSYLVDFDYTGATMTNNPVAVYIHGKDSTAAALQVNSSGVPAGGIVEVVNTNAGALGSVLRLQQTGGSQANSDVVAKIMFTGQDDAAATEEYAKVEVVPSDVAAATPDADMNFYVDVAGTLTQRLQISGAVNGVEVGSGAATAIVSSNGAYDLTLETNNGTDSGVITITDAANGNIAITPNGTGKVNLTAPTYGQYTALADGAATLTVAQVGLVTMGNTAARQVDLPNAAAGLWYTVKKTSADAFAITVATADAGTIDGAATYAAIDAQYDVATFVCDGTNWHIVSKIIAA